MGKNKKLKIGDAAPEGYCLSVDEQTVALSRFWQDGPVLLTFLRHFG
jgi:peroxiredoxin